MNDRRQFLRTLLTVSAATALPSEVWPFRKIFIPAEPKIVLPPLEYFIIDYPFIGGPNALAYPGRLLTSHLEAKALVEHFNQRVIADKKAKGLPLSFSDLASVSRPMYPSFYSFVKSIK